MDLRRNGQQTTQCGLSGGYLAPHEQVGPQVQLVQVQFGLVHVLVLFVVSVIVASSRCPRLGMPRFLYACRSTRSVVGKT